MNDRARGFALITVVLMIALTTVSALVVLEVITTERSQQADERRQREARLGAEGGLMEVMNDQNVLGIMPSPDDASLSATYQPATDSAFDTADELESGVRYQARIDLVRVAPLLESSHGLVRAVVYEVDVQAETESGAASWVDAEVYRVVSSKTGVMRPRVHAR